MKTADKSTVTLTPAQQFFFEHAGWGYDPSTETKEEGRTRGAIALAAAESEAREKGYSFEWGICPLGDSSDFSDELPAWSLWACICRNSEGESVSNLHAIDFGRDGTPWGSTYRRVVEAEMAMEALA